MAMTHLEDLPTEMLFYIVNFVKKPTKYLLATEPNRGAVDFKSVFRSVRPNKDTDLKKLSLVIKSMRKLIAPILF
jgi:hypothetical protein